MHDQGQFWLDTGRPDLALDRRCLHWPLAFPEVFLVPGRCGFDAIIGNPPFLGGQRITGALGTAYRHYLVDMLAGGRRGSADLVAYFFLRAFGLLQEPGRFGLLATNTIAQGDTREVGLDRLAERGATITRAVPSEPWPGTTSLEVAKIWVHKGEWRGGQVLSGSPVRAISPMLVVPGRAVGNPYRLKANEGKSYIGSYVLGMGFVMTPEEAQALIAQDARNRDVLFPYLNGEDLNSRPDQSASRWVINFKDWPLERSAAGLWTSADDEQQTEWRRSGRVPNDYPDPVAADFPTCLEIVRTKVKPERERNNRAVYRNRWWQYAEKRPELYNTITGLQRVIVKSEVGNRLSFALVPSGIVFSHMLIVFASGDYSLQLVLQSSLHEVWAREYGSSMRTDLRYTPSDCFDTFPLPVSSDSLEQLGGELNAVRSATMHKRAEGLTKTYARLHEELEQSPDVVCLRELHLKLDQAVAAAYDWTDIRLDHGFYKTKQGIRFTISHTARQEILDRLRELNHQRYAEEVAQGLHDKLAAKGKARATSKKGKRKVSSTPLLEGA